MGRWKYESRKVITTVLGERVIELGTMLEACCSQQGGECPVAAECTSWWDSNCPLGPADFSPQQFIELLGQFELRRQQLRKVSKSSEMSHAQKEVLGAGVKRGW